MAGRLSAGAALCALLMLFDGAFAVGQEPTPEPSPTPSSSPSQAEATPTPTPTTTAAQATPTPTPSAPAATPSPQETTPMTEPAPEGNGSLTLDTRVSSSLVQIGDEVTQEVVVSNSGTAEVEQVVVRYDVPAEMDVVGVTSPSGATDTTTMTGSAVTIRWTGFDLSAGETKTFSWAGRVARAGDLVAKGSVEASAEGVAAAQATQSVYLAAVTGVHTVAEGRETVVQQRLVTRSVPAAGAATTQADANLLPVTGFDLWAYAALALFVMALGALTWRASLSHSRLRAAPLLLLGLALAACTSGEPVEERASRTPTAAPSPTVETQVKGKMIVRGEHEDGTDRDDATDDGPETGAATGEDAVVSPADGTEQTLGGDAGSATVDEKIILVEVPVSEAPTAKLGATEGRNVIGLEWSETDGLITATSGLTLTEAAAEISNSLAAEDTEIKVTVTIANTSSTHRLDVEGTIEHVIGGFEDPVVLRSAPISMTLAPKEVVATTFTYALPSGAYTLSSRFVP